MRRVVAGMGEEVPRDWAFECYAAITAWGVKKSDEKYGIAYVPACGQTCDYCECPIPGWLVDIWQRRREIERICEEAKKILGKSDTPEAALLAQLVNIICPQ